jgi:CheY-like chemotaxis protein
MTTILLVEDDEVFREAAALHLGESGFAVITAENSIIALSELDGRTVDLAVIDVLMPPGYPQGFALGRMLRQRRPGLPIFYMSGYREVLDAEGIQDHLFMKPIDLDCMTKAIETRLALSSASQGLAASTLPCAFALLAAVLNQVPPGRRARLARAFGERASRKGGFSNLPRAQTAACRLERTVRASCVPRDLRPRLSAHVRSRRPHRHARRSTPAASARMPWLQGRGTAPRE